MRRVLSIIFGSIIAGSVFVLVDGKNCDLAFSDDQIELEDDIDLWIDTVMYAKGHAFGYNGDISMWGGWYLDTMLVGDDNMLQYDSVGPSTLKLSLVTRELNVDLGDADVVEKFSSS